VAERSSIVWTALLRAKNEDGANRLVLRLQKALGAPVRVTALGPYWKDDALYRCMFATSLADGSPAETTQTVLTLAGQLAPTWHIGGLGAGGDLWGVADRQIVVSGVDWLGFGLDRPQEPGD
jgi:hypothetical protein